LALGRLADQPLAIVGKSDDRRRGAHAFGILDDLGVLALHHRNARTGRAEVDTDDLAHIRKPLCSAGRPGPFGIPEATSDERPLKPPLVDRSRSDPPWITLKPHPLRRLRSYRRALGGRKRDDHENASVARGKPPLWPSGYQIS